MLLIEHAGTEALEPCGVSIGFEASGQLGVVRATVSRVLLPEAACDVAYVTCTVHGENSSCGRVGTARFCERVGGASALPRPPAGWAQKKIPGLVGVRNFQIQSGKCITWGCLSC